MKLVESTSSHVSAVRAGQQGKKSFSIITQKASEVEIKPIHWLWNHRIALGKLCMVSGNPGIGKSQITANIAAVITTGGEFPDGSTCTKGTVIFISAEDDAADTIVPRLTAAGANLDLVHILNYVLSEDSKCKAELHFSLASHLPELEDLIVKLRNVAAIIIDPITAYLGKIDANSNSDVRSILSPLAKIAEKYNIAIICISHNNKSVSQQAMHRVIGSVGFIAACRSAYIVIKDDDDPHKRLFLPLKNNNGNDNTGLAFHIESVLIKDNIQTSKVTWLKEAVIKTADEVMSCLQFQSEKSALQEAEEFLCFHLQRESMPANEIKELAQKESISRGTLLRAKRKLNINVSRRGFGKGSQSFWSLPSNIEDQNLHT